jgi:hypothetical protein
MATNSPSQVFLEQLKAWCAATRGRKTIAAKYLAEAVGLSFETAQQTLSHWFAEPVPRQQPTADQILAVQAFLKRKRITSHNTEL